MRITTMMMMMMMAMLSTKSKTKMNYHDEYDNTNNVAVTTTIGIYCCPL